MGAAKGNRASRRGRRCAGTGHTPAGDAAGCAGRRQQPDRRRSKRSGRRQLRRSGGRASARPGTGRAAARVSASMPGSRPTGATRMFAPQPLESATVAVTQGIPIFRRAQALRQVMPGARSLSGLSAQATNACRSGPSRQAAVQDSPASISASPTASAIWVSSVTRAGSPGGSAGPSGPNRCSISRTLRNSVLAARASPSARPNRQPEAQPGRFVMSYCSTRAGLTAGPKWGQKG